ncbi:MAG TPA: hypothetical protein VMB03_18215 [Bryobacteraceae bacterium]|nr:hypothetical protein [Bryobacteraceae bacterium]
MLQFLWCGQDCPPHDCAQLFGDAKNYLALTAVPVSEHAPHVFIEFMGYLAPLAEAGDEVAEHNRDNTREEHEDRHAENDVGHRQPE